ncbi:hypothetical protein [Propionispora vibrioides]|uniref:Nudix hydrolase domain-containing protein n=1 Tax=Propionispora vibrioides TaxID=112903 RepID=A0A1H8XLH2_9FIRM|nr:hypothetical protein [Propionispora vibrioides]SEP40954.1 hypothetical protein SAMN04490178_1267 [Propionispora vibrioides]
MNGLPISVKGVLKKNDKYLLRINERNEYELLGGHLEANDFTIKDRLKTEFREESGIEIDVCELYEPWLYEIGESSVLIIPFFCSPRSTPNTLIDQDGGRLEWVDENRIVSLPMPQGYKDTILKVQPHKSYSKPAKKYFKIIPNYQETKFHIIVTIHEKHEVLLSQALPTNASPMDFALYSLQMTGRRYKTIRIHDLSLCKQTLSLNYETLS